MAKRQFAEKPYNPANPCRSSRRASGAGLICRSFEDGTEKPRISCMFGCGGGFCPRRMAHAKNR